jgi:hypothetical protein
MHIRKIRAEEMYDTSIIDSGARAGMAVLHASVISGFPVFFITDYAHCECMLNGLSLGKWKIRNIKN